MSIALQEEDKAFIQALLNEDVSHIEPGSTQALRLRESFQTAIDQQNREADANLKRTGGFLLLFIFLYTVLGTSLTLNVSAEGASHKSIEYALQAVPVLIAFSGFFISVLFLFTALTSARRYQSWEKVTGMLENYASGNLFKQVALVKGGVNNYSLQAITITLAGFVCLTWLILYNYFTYTTSGVIGSVISLFISTMVYVILDIQLLKPATSQDVKPPEAADSDQP